MRRLNLCLCFVLAAALSANVMGQDVLTKAAKEKSSAVAPSLGILAGANLSNQWGPGVTRNRDIALGVNGGIAVPLEFNEHFVLEPEVQYYMKGTAWDTTESKGENLSYSIRLQYLEIPVLAKFSVPVTGLVKPYIYLGVSGGTLLAASKGAWGPGSHRLPFDYSDSVSRVDASVLGGACTHVFVGKGYLILDGRFIFGLWDVGRHGRDIHNWTASLEVGYAWKLRKEKQLW